MKAHLTSESVNTSHSLCGGGISTWYMKWGVLNTVKGCTALIVVGQKSKGMQTKKVMVYCKEQQEKVTEDALL